MFFLKVLFGYIGRGGRKAAVRALIEAVARALSMPAQMVEDVSLQAKIQQELQLMYHDSK